METPKLAKSDKDILACSQVMRELRPHISEEDFLSRIRRQQEQGYHLAQISEKGVVCAVAGFRILENLAWGKFLYLDDLVTADDSRSKGYGGVLFDWLIDYAKKESCAEFHLDSGVQRFGAHRFYLQKRMKISSHHFVLPIS